MYLSVCRRERGVANAGRARGVSPGEKIPGKNPALGGTVRGPMNIEGRNNVHTAHETAASLQRVNYMPLHTRVPPAISMSAPARTKGYRMCIQTVYRPIRSNHTPALYSKCRGSRTGTSRGCTRFAHGFGTVQAVDAQCHGRAQVWPDANGLGRVDDGGPGGRR